MIKKTAFLLILLVTVITIKAQNVAYIDTNIIFKELKGFAEKKSKLDSLNTKLSNEVKALQEELQTKYKSLTEPYAPKSQENTESLKKRMSVIDAEKLTLLEDEQKFIDAKIKSYSNQIKEQYRVEIQPFVNKVDAIIEKYCKSNKITMVYKINEMGTSVAYFDKQRDITQVILQEANKGDSEKK